MRADTEKYFVARVVPFFFCLADLANVRHTYQFGLHWFMRLFNDALVTCLRNSTGARRVWACRNALRRVTRAACGFAGIDACIVNCAVLDVEWRANVQASAKQQLT